MHMHTSTYTHSPAADPVPGGKKHEIYATTFGCRLFKTYLYMVRGTWSLIPGSATAHIHTHTHTHTHTDRGVKVVSGKMYMLKFAGQSFTDLERY